MNGKPAVALLELSTDIVFNEHVQPVCLASNDHLLLHPINDSPDAWMASWEKSPPIGVAEVNMTQVHVRSVSPDDSVHTIYGVAEQRTSNVSAQTG